MKFISAALMVMGTSLSVLGSGAALAAPLGGGGSPGGTGASVLTLEIIQTGADNEIVIEQVRSSTSRLGIKQFGNDQHIGQAINNVPGSTGPLFGISQTDVNGGTVSITQDGVGGNYLELHQNTVTGGSALIYQVPTTQGSASQHNQANIDQTRTTGLTANIQQTGTASNTASILQRDSNPYLVPGMSRRTDVEQVDFQCTPTCVEFQVTPQSQTAGLTDPSQPENGSAVIIQNGASNTASIQQTDSLAAQARVVQTDTGHSATVLQSHVSGVVDLNDAATPTLGAIYSLVSDSNGNPISYSLDRTIYHEFVSKLLPAEVTVTQSGTAQLAYVNQDGTQLLSGMGATVSQSGAGNGVTLNQINSSRGTASATQDGTLNTATILQDGTTTSSARIDQTPVSSGGSVTGNIATIEQHVGTNLIAEIYQKSDLNIASILQTGDGHFALIGQGGAAGNEAWITQGGVGHSARIVQDGSGNHALITQLGTGNNAMIEQVGNGFGTHAAPTTISQNGINLNAIISLR